MSRDLFLAQRGNPTFPGELFTYRTGRIYSVSSTGSVALLYTLPLSQYSDPGGIDPRPPNVYVGATRPDQDEVIALVNLSTGSITHFFSFPLDETTPIMGDVKLDSGGVNIYNAYSPSGSGSNLYKNGSAIRANGLVGLIDVDCADRVRFTEPAANQIVLYVPSTGQFSTAASGVTQPIGIDADRKGDVFVARSTAIQRVDAAKIGYCSHSGYQVTFSGDVRQVYADYNPVSQTESENSQFVVLTACLGDPLIPRTSTDGMCWFSRDVDDPSSHTTIDPNDFPFPGFPLDNVGTLDSPEEFTSESGYPHFTTGCPGTYGTRYDSQGCSKVRMHVTDAPGDNYVAGVTALTRIGSVEATSGIMTVWKRLHVEKDSMGIVSGPLDPAGDDALIGDVPDADLGLLAGAFRPAYIEIVANATHDSGSVAFDPHVPDIRVGATEAIVDSQIETQCRTPVPPPPQPSRPRTSVSTPGAWWLYIQMGYESGEDVDHDDTAEVTEEVAEMGLTWGPVGALGKWSLTYTETVRDFLGAYEFDEAYGLKLVTLHELGHQFGLDDEPVAGGGCPPRVEVMNGFCATGPPTPSNYIEAPPPIFTPAEISTMREMGQPDNSRSPSSDPP